MPLPSGTRLGPYEILAPLGAGGMGEVYRAHDSRLGRDVAIKVLPQHLAATPEVRARFEREARTISQLNHPHICALYDVGHQDGIDFLVMELIDGDTLADRLAKGPLPLGQVLQLGARIADALDRAHRAGVVHRDLKPGNVMLTKDGAKLMDFGLARSTGMAGSGTGSFMSHSPTIAAPLTAEGTIVGTFQYMAPEQLEGKEADARSDLWSLGCVLYEMATGKRAFEGTTQASLISAIMRDHPRAISELLPTSPPAFERLVNTLLAKDPDDRMQTAHDARLQLQWMIDPVSAPSPSGISTKAARVPRSGALALAWGVAGISLALALAAWLVPPGRDAGHPERTRLVVPDPPLNRLLPPAVSSAISPDGRTLAFVAVDSTGLTRLWLRPLSALTARVLPGTEHGDAPFWSPDCRSLGFFADGKLRSIRLDDGTIRTLGEAPDPRGGTWGSQGVIVFAPNAEGPLFSVPVDGGPASELIRPDSTRGEAALRFPCFLPDGRQFTYVTLPPPDPGGYPVRLGRLGSGDSTPLMQADAAPVFAEPGWLVTLRGDRLVAQGFDAGSGKVSGSPITLGEAPALSGHDGVRAVSVSRTGILAYPARRESDSQVVWLDRRGRIERRLSLPAGRWETVSLSPDGVRAVLNRRRSALEREVWLMDVSSAQATRIGTVFSNGFDGIWSPDGSRFVYSSKSGGQGNLLVQSVDGGPPETLYQSRGQFNNPFGWSPDGRIIAFESPSRETGWDVWGLPVQGDHRPTPLVQTPFNEGGGWFSPDGRWIVYYSDETGGNELYVQSFPVRSTRSTIPGSGTGAAFPGPCWWTRDGREILFKAGNSSIRSVDVEPGDTFRCGRAQVLFEIGDNVISLCPTPDHSRFLAIMWGEETSASGIVIDTNWPAALQKP